MQDSFSLWVPAGGIVCGQGKNLMKKPLCLYSLIFPKITKELLNNVIKKGKANKKGNSNNKAMIPANRKDLDFRGILV